jgi:hypothetical protein
MKTGTKILIGAVAVIALLIAVKLLLSDASFSPANPSWDGVSGMMAGTTRPLYGFDGLPMNGSGSTLLIVSPATNFTQDDAARTRDFLQQGGRVVVMDDFGTADSLLQGIGAQIAINHTPLCQDLEYYYRPAFPVVREIGDSSLTANVNQLTFNHPAPLEVSGDAEVLVRTTVMGWLDFDGRGTLNGNEKYDSSPLIAREVFGAGELFVVGDADLVINGMQDLGDDGVLARNLLRSGTTYLDVGHGQQVPPVAVLYYLIKYNLAAQLLLALFIFMLGYAYVLRGRTFRRAPREEPPRDTRAGLIASMRARLPLSDREIEEINKKL